MHRRYIVTQRRHTRTLKRVGRHPAFVIPLATFFVLLLITVGAFVFFNGGSPKLRASDSHLVIVSHDKKEQTVPTRAQTVGELLQKLSITLNEGDVVEPAASTPVQDDNFRVNVYRATPVTIVDGDHKTFTYSAAATPRSVAKQVGVQVYPEDNLVSVPTDNFLTEGSIGERVVIDRATPVMLNLYGTPVTIRTHSKTVGDVLKERNVKLSADDTIQPAAPTPITAETQIFLVRKGTQITTEQQDIAADVQTVDDSNLTFGTTAIRQQGVAGKKIITYQLQMENGKEIGRTKIQEVTTQEPVTQIVAKGTFFDLSNDKSAVLTAAGISNSNYMYVNYVIEHESHWNPAAVNASGCTGLGQACPGSKLAAACPSWRSDPVCQMKFFNQYAVGRYGSWASAYNHKVAYGWW
jgi:uncharacterized protein YabE (DUF348 family)